MARNVLFCLNLNAILFLDNSATLYKLNELEVVQVSRTYICKCRFRWRCRHGVLGGVYMWKLAPVRVWNRHDIVISYRVYMKGHFVSTDVIVTPYWIGYRRLRMGYPLQTPGRVISCWSERPYRVYMTSEWVFVPEWKSCSGTVTGLNSHRYDSLWYEILCWYHVNE